MALNKAQTKVRLTKDVLPKHYNLTIHPDLESFTFAGTEIIDIELAKKTKTLVLHSAEIEVLNCFWQVGKSELIEGKISYNVKQETVTFTFPKLLAVGKGKLHLEFRGLISENLCGFYRSQYTHKGQVKHLVTTQFESTDARRAFPCFDEPSHKAVFELKLIIPNHLTAISNTVSKTLVATPEGIEHDENLKVIHFEPTPKMSTYLLAYVVGEFEHIETKTKDGVTIRVFTTPDKKQHAKFALNVAKKALEFLNSYFDVPFPIPVLDMIAIPDFSAGAMENWGAITFREAAIFVDEEHTAFANKQHVAEVVAHELVHQWFGNLVTMEWWTHLWLNESFAAFMCYMVMDEIFPEWNIWTRFVMHDHANALLLDSLDNTHPIEVEVHHPDQISEIFDAISYDKGGSVLRMLLNYIGPENFRDGLRYYLKKHSYKNTESIHLWDAFEKVSKKPIAKFMSNWVSKKGYPVITAIEKNSQKILLTQSRFSINQKSQAKKDKTIWPIPVKLQGLEVFNSKSVVIPNDGKFLKLNSEETGFYRTLYSPSLLAKLYPEIQNKTLSTLDRFGIIRDVFAMTKSGLLPTSAFLEFISAYTNEESYIIWAEILSNMKEVYDAFSSDRVLERKLKKHYLNILAPVAKKVGWKSKTGEDPSRGLLRGAVLAEFGFYGDAVTLENAKKIYKQKNINPDLRGAVYYLMGLQGNSTTSKDLKKKYTTHHLQEEQRRINTSLMSFTDPKLLLDHLDFSLSKKVRPQDASLFVARGLSANPHKKLVWKWLQKNWKTFDSRYKGDHLLFWVAKGLEGFSTENEAKEIINFFKKHPAPSIDRAIKQSLEQIRLKASWLKRDKSDCIKFLSQL